MTQLKLTLQQKQVKNNFSKEKDPLLATYLNFLGNEFENRLRSGNVAQEDEFLQTTDAAKIKSIFTVAGHKFKGSYPKKEKEAQKWENMIYEGIKSGSVSDYIILIGEIKKSIPKTMPQPEMAK
ncbi:MAG: hypothetical protein LBU87_01115 [Lactobacillales bacterium]|jgi:hypothetical protein|nr:hypothetical protein [Lactobacillales bacterium]